MRLLLESGAPPEEREQVGAGCLTKTNSSNANDGAVANGAGIGVSDLRLRTRREDSTSRYRITPTNGYLAARVAAAPLGCAG
jgi:hypothetical protein